MVRVPAVMMKLRVAPTASLARSTGNVSALAVRLAGHNWPARAPIPARSPVSALQCPMHFQYCRALSVLSARAKEQSHHTHVSELNHDVTPEEKSQYDRVVAKSKKAQTKTPWHREGSDTPPVGRQRSAGAMVKGKLLTTPTRLFKLVLPLTTKDYNQDRKDIEPLSLLIHPQQPLSYLERLIQSEVPSLQEGDKEKIPSVDFLAQDVPGDELGGTKDTKDAHEQTAADARADSRDKSNLGPSGVGSYSGLGREREQPQEENFVKWSKSTEIGDFIRDAARGHEFAVVIQGGPNEIRVGVPSFRDRTHYLRMRLRKKAREILNMAELKKECDLQAYNSAQRVAYLGFGGLSAWAVIVWWLTFMTNLGWDFMEPVTYLVGMVGILGGYGWFLRNNREASYRAAMNLTVSRRQQKLYDEKGFDLQKWEHLVDEGNALRKEIRAIAAEYDVDWDEKKDAQDDSVVEALKESRTKQRKEKERKRKEDADEEDEDE